MTVETSRKTVAHLEGGIVRKILVREGQLTSVELPPLVERHNAMATALVRG